MTSNITLCALQYAYEFQSFEKNFETLCTLLNQCPKNSIILAPELCLSAYSYDTMHEAVTFSTAIVPKLKTLSLDKTFGLTLITCKENHFFNTFMLFHKGECVYTQDKAKLFALGDETRYFCAGATKSIQIFELDGIKIAVLICFELRFPSLWEQVKGVDIILIPAFWGEPRKAHFEALSTALAIANQTYVMCANSADSGMARSSGIISPFGVASRDDSSNVITVLYDAKEIKTMRRYIDIGLNTHASHGSF
jgi:predicted amidohydrolase